MKQDKPTGQKQAANQKQTSNKQHGTEQKAGQKTQGNSINFEKCDYDTKQHLLRAQFKQGGNSITCSINENVLTELYDCSPNNEQELKASFKQHQPEISRALLAKIANKQWKVPNKEIQLNAQDLQK